MFFVVFVFVCLTLEFTIYFCGTSKLAYPLGLNKLVEVRLYELTFTNLLVPKLFALIFFRLKNKTALIPSLILLLSKHYDKNATEDYIVFYEITKHNIKIIRRKMGITSNIYTD